MNKPLLHFQAIPRAAAVLAGALLMTWLALYNRYPLLYPDSMSYMEDGPLVARALFLHQFSIDYGGRSFLYCLGILPFHWNVTPWPIVALNALLAAYVIWLVVRSLSPRQAIARYFALLLPLIAFTSLPWFVSLIMPDILGPVLYLSIYLLIFARKNLSRAEHRILLLISWWAVASHITHLILAAGFCFLFLLLQVFRRSLRCWFAGIAQVALIVVFAAAAHLALHTYLYGQPSLNGERPPFLMARVLVDGPGRSYLLHHCADKKFVLCNYLSKIPNDSNDFLWNADGVWQSASDDTQELLRQEEMPFVLATLRAYPREQLSASAANFREQLITFGLEDYFPNQWVSDVFERVLPGARPHYLQTRQARRALPDEFSSTAQEWMVLASLAIMAILTPLLWRRRSPQLLGLASVILFMLVANALVTGVLSDVLDRYQSRVIWLLPLLAGLFLLEWLDHRFRPVGQPEPQRHDALSASPRLTPAGARDSLHTGSLPTHQEGHPVSNAPFLIRFRALLPVLAAAGLFLAHAPVARSQAPPAPIPSPAMRVSVRLVLVDALVTDKEGNVVKGLGPQDFSVLEDGKVQNVTNVSFEQPALLAREVRSQRAALPPNVTTNRPAFRMPSGQVIVVLLDSLNTRTKDQSYARLELLKYLGTQVQPGQQIAVYTLGNSLRLLQDFTDNPALLKAAVESFQPNVSVQMMISDLDARMPRTSGAQPESKGVQIRDMAVPLQRMQDFLNEQINLITDARVGTTLTAFRWIAQSVAGLPGRKNLIWVSGSFPLATYSRIIKYSADGSAANDPSYVRAEHEYEDMIRETSSVLNDAQMAVYPVDARGLIGQLLGGAEETGLTLGGTLKTGSEYGQDLQMASSGLQETQATMQQFAGDTGGKVFLNRNDLDHAVALSMQDGAAYYLLAFSPTSKVDGKFHKIEVKVNRPGVSVRSRRGFYALPTSDDPKYARVRDGEVRMAMQAAAPVATGVIFDARVQPPAPAAKMKVPVDFLVDPSTLYVEDAGGGSKRLAIEFHAVAYQQDGKVAGQRDVATKATLKAADFASIQQQGLLYHLDLELPPGLYKLRLGVVDQHSGFIGTADFPLQLDAPK